MLWLHFIQKISLHFYHVLRYFITFFENFRTTETTQHKGWQIFFWKLFQKQNTNKFFLLLRMRYSVFRVCCKLNKTRAYKALKYKAAKFESDRVGFLCKHSKYSYKRFYFCCFWDSYFVSEIFTMYIIENKYKKHIEVTFYFKWFPK